MSRLDSMLRRLAAQRDGLNWAAERIADLPGDVLDIGLGNGRTYDHLRDVLPERRILVIDRELNCHPSCVPPPADFLQGEADAQLSALAAQGVRLALVHYDLGFGDDARDAQEAARLSPLVAAVLAPGAVVVSGQPLRGLAPLAGPDSIAPDRYKFYHG